MYKTIPVVLTAGQTATAFIQVPGRALGVCVPILDTAASLRARIQMPSIAEPLLMLTVDNLVWGTALAPSSAGFYQPLPPMPTGLINFQVVLSAAQTGTITFLVVYEDSPAIY